MGVVRYGAGTGRFRRLQLQANLEAALYPLADAGWSLDFQAVRRHLNVAADRLATAACHLAATLRAAGTLTPVVRVDWLIAGS